MFSSLTAKREHAETVAADSIVISDDDDEMNRQDKKRCMAESKDAESDCPDTLGSPDSSDPSDSPDTAATATAATGDDEKKRREVEEKRNLTNKSEEDQRAKIAATEESLPKTGLIWSVVFPNSEIFLSLIKIASPVLSERIRFYPTKKKGFTGIVIDEFDPTHAALMIGRLCCPVKIIGPDGHDAESGEISVTVPTECLAATLKGMCAQQTVAMYQQTDSANVFFSILDSATGHVRHDDIPTLCGMAHSTLRTLKFQYELTIAVGDFKRDIGHITAKGIAVVTLSLRKAPESQTFLLVLTGTGERGNTFSSLPISSVPIQERVHDGAGGEAVENAPVNLVHTVAALQATHTGSRVTTDERHGTKEFAPTCKYDIEKLPATYKASFSVKYIEKMIKSLKDDSQMTLFLGDKPSILPLIIRFGLDIKQGVESYAAFVLAANVEETC